MQHTRTIIFFTAAALAVLGGFGCQPSSSSTGSGVPTTFDDVIGLSVHMPGGWVSVPFDTYYRNSAVASGLQQIFDARQFGFGPQGADGTVPIKIFVIAIPKNSAAIYDGARDPEYAARAFETDSYVVYTATKHADDVGVQEILKTLQIKK